MDKIKLPIKGWYAVKEKKRKQIQSACILDSKSLVFQFHSDDMLAQNLSSLTNPT